MSARVWVSVSSFGHPASETELDRYLERAFMRAEGDPFVALQDAIRVAGVWAKVREEHAV